MRIRGKAMQHMNSVRVLATIIFTALLVIILVSSSRTTYTLAPPKQQTLLAACAVPPSFGRDAAEPRACARPAAPWLRRVHQWPGAAPDSAERAAAPVPADTTPAMTPIEEWSDRALNARASGN
jgi:hypothetical protein